MHKTTQKIIEICNCNLSSLKLVKPLTFLIGGDNNGIIHLYQWPFKEHNKYMIKYNNENSNSKKIIN